MNDLLQSWIDDDPLGSWTCVNLSLTTLSLSFDWSIVLRLFELSRGIRRWWNTRNTCACNAVGQRKHQPLSSCVKTKWFRYRWPRLLCAPRRQRRHRERGKKEEINWKLNENRFQNQRIILELITCHFVSILEWNCSLKYTKLMSFNLSTFFCCLSREPRMKCK